MVEREVEGEEGQVEQEEVEAEKEEEEEGAEAAEEETDVGGGGDWVCWKLDDSDGIFSLQVVDNDQHRDEVPQLEARRRLARVSRWCRRFSSPQLGRRQTRASVGAWLWTWDAGCGRRDGKEG